MKWINLFFLVACSIALVAGIATGDRAIIAINAFASLMNGAALVFKIASAPLT